MSDFNTPVSPSDSDKLFSSTFSITTLVRDEIQSMLRAMSIANQYIRKEEIDELVERCLRDKVTILHEHDDGTMPTSPNTSDQLHVTVEMSNQRDDSREQQTGGDNLIIENFEILEQRINNLETCVSTLLQTIPKWRDVQATKFRLNTDLLKAEIVQLVQKTNALDTSASQKNDGGGDNDWMNLYDSMFYESRERAMNMLYYQKSDASLALNERLQFNSTVAPSPLDPKLLSRPKRQSMFILENCAKK